MRVPRRILGSVLSALLLFCITPATAQAAEGRARHDVDCPADHRSAQENTAPYPQLEEYDRGDWRLGPADLPRSGPIGRMLRGYRPEGPTTSYWFLGCYWQTNPQNEPNKQVGGWWYPDNDGFVLQNDRPVKHLVTLQKGQMIDLFGKGDSGHFLAPEGTPYAKRAIPPSNLDEYSSTSPALNYHLYRVVAPFTVEAGPARPWFNQPGLGLQYHTNASVGDLIGSGNLQEVTVA